MLHFPCIENRAICRPGTPQLMSLSPRGPRVSRELEADFRPYKLPREIQAYIALSLCLCLFSTCSHSPGHTTNHTSRPRHAISAAKTQSHAANPDSTDGRASFFGKCSRCLNHRSVSCDYLRSGIATRRPHSLWAFLFARWEFFFGRNQITLLRW